MTHKPDKCSRGYRLIILRKNLSVEQGELMLYEEIRYFLYLTNIPHQLPSELVFSANDRCDQENPIAHVSATYQKPTRASPPPPLRNGRVLSLRSQVSLSKRHAE